MFKYISTFFMEIFFEHEKNDRYEIKQNPGQILEFNFFSNLMLFYIINQSEILFFNFNKLISDLDIHATRGVQKVLS